MSEENSYSNKKNAELVVENRLQKQEIEKLERENEKAKKQPKTKRLSFLINFLNYLIK